MILESLAIQFDLVCRRQLLWGPPFHTQIDPALPDSFFAEFRFLHASGRTGSSSNPGEALVLRPHHRQLQCHHRDHEAGLRMVTWHGLAMEGGFFGVFVEFPNCFKGDNLHLKSGCISRSEGNLGRNGCNYFQFKLSEFPGPIHPNLAFVSGCAAVRS